MPTPYLPFGFGLPMLLPQHLPMPSQRFPNGFLPVPEMLVPGPCHCHLPVARRVGHPGYTAYPPPQIVGCSGTGSAILPRGLTASFPDVEVVGVPQPGVVRIRQVGGFEERVVPSSWVKSTLINLPSAPFEPAPALSAEDVEIASLKARLLAVTEEICKVRLASEVSARQRAERIKREHRIQQELKEKFFKTLDTLSECYSEQIKLQEIIQETSEEIAQMSALCV